MSRFKRIAIHMSGCVSVKDDGLWVRGQYGYLIEELSKYTDELCLLLDDDYQIINKDSFDSKTDYNIKSENVKFISLGRSGGMYEFFNRLVIMNNNLSNERFDFILIREPSRRSPFIKFFCKKVPIVYLFGGDREAQLNDNKNIRIKLRAYLFTYMLKKSLNNSLIYVNNADLYRKWKNYATNIFILKTTTVKKKQINDHPIKRFKNIKNISVLYVGRLDPLKGIGTLIDAISKVNQLDNRIWRLDILGSGEETYIKELYNIVNKLKLSDHVKFHNYVDFENIFQFYKNADVLVLPTLAENVSRVIWEAMASSCPVITTSVGGHKYTFKDNEDVIFFRPNDSGDLVKKLMSLSKDQKQCQRLTSNGLQTVKKNTIEIMVENLTGGIELWMNRI